MKTNNYYKYKNILEKIKKYAYSSANSMAAHGTKSKKSKPMQRMKNNIKRKKYKGLDALLCKEGKAEVHVRTT